MVSLEAPLVAVIWLVALARAHGLQLMPEVYAGLGLVVWGIYLVDRMVDARSWKEGSSWTARHAFCARNSVLLCWVFLPLLVVAVAWLALFRVSETLLWHALMIAALVAGYMLWHVLRAPPAKIEEREASKGLLASALFALGVCAGVYAHEFRYPGWAMMVGQALLTCLFATNLFGLGVIEREKEGGLGDRIRVSYHTARLAAFVMGVGVWLPWVEVVRPLRLLSLAVLMGVVMMSVIHAKREHLSEIGYRCLVDAVLVVSALLLIWLAA
jgi:hypothetical protein